MRAKLTASLLPGTVRWLAWLTVIGHWAVGNVPTVIVAGLTLLLAWLTLRSSRNLESLMDRAVKVQDRFAGSAERLEFVTRHERIARAHGALLFAFRVIGDLVTDVAIAENELAMGNYGYLRNLRREELLTEVLRLSYIEPDFGPSNQHNIAFLYRDYCSLLSTIENATVTDEAKVQLLRQWQLRMQKGRNDLAPVIVAVKRAARQFDAEWAKKRATWPSADVSGKASPEDARAAVPTTASPEGAKDWAPPKDAVGSSPGLGENEADGGPEVGR